MKIRILGSRNKGNSKITTLEFRRDNSDLFRHLLGRIPWENVLGEKRRPGELVGFQGSPPPISRMVHLMSRKSRKGGKGPAWMNKKLLTKIRCKNEERRRRKQEQVTQEKYRCCLSVQGLGKLKFFWS